MSEQALEAKYPWDQCIRDQTARYGSKTTAEKVCGMIKAKYGGKSAVEGEIPEPEALVAEAEQSLGLARRREQIDVALAPRAGGAFRGQIWDVTLLGPETEADLVRADGREYVRSKNGRFYAVDGLRESAPLWDGIKVYDNHLTDREFAEREGMRSARNEWVGTIVDPRWNEAERRLEGTLKLVDRAMADKLVNAHDVGVLESVGLSIDTFPIDRPAVIEGKRVVVTERFQRLNSVDVVPNPAAGGGFNRLIASVRRQEVTMTSLTDEMRAEIRTAVAEALATTATTEQVAADAPPEEVAAEVAAAAEAAAADAPPDASPEQVAQDAADAAQAVADEIAAQTAQGQPPAQPTMESVDQRLRRLEAERLLDRLLIAARLPAGGAQIVRQAFAGRAFQAPEVQRVIESVRRTLATRDASGRVVAGGRGVVVSMFSEQDKRQIELLRLVAGNLAMRALESNQAPYVQERLKGLSAYAAWIKHGRQNYGTRRLSNWFYEAFGNPFVDGRVYEAESTSSLSTIVKNTVNIILAADYSVRQEWWAPLVREEEVDTIDTVTLARIFGLGNLSIVNEGAAYTPLDWADEEETATFVKRGNYLGITLETFLQDKLNVLRTIPQRLANAWYNTLSARVSAVFTINSDTGPQLSDGGALFNATAVGTATGHANLLTAALSFTSYGTARTALMKQTDQPLGAGQALMIRPALLRVPIDLEGMARQICETEFLPGSANNDRNPYYNEAKVIVDPHEDDANNWALIGDPQVFPAIWLFYVTGNRVPVIFTADDESSGAMFSNDELRYKVRMLTFRFSSTYDCAPVSDFRPLHKSNVA